MKSKLLLLLFLSVLSKSVFAENIDIIATNITIDKNTQSTIFKNNVVIKDIDGNIIKSNFAEYKKKEGFIVLKDDITISDKDNNVLKTNRATYDTKDKILKTFENTSFVSAEGYKLNSSDIELNIKDRSIYSNNLTELVDLDGNIITLQNFDYESLNKIFKSIGKVEINDNRGNSYLFSQLIIDTKKKEMVGTDIKAFLNEESFKINKKNKPRIFANTVQFKNSNTKFQKSKFTFCDYRKNDKCPPWELSAKEMKHDAAKKTIYYKNVVVKIYAVPVLYFPYFFHPDPTVKRQSGFLAPSFSNSKSLGASFKVPYFYAIDKDKDITITSRMFAEQHPLVIAEYRQAFKDSNLKINLGYTEGLKKDKTNIALGERSHAFLNFVKKFQSNNRNNQLELNFENISNRKYLKTYRIKNDLADYNENLIENSLKFYSDGNEDFFSIEAKIYEDLKDDRVEKYEYILPDVSYGKNLVNNNYLGNIDLISNFKAENYETNKTKKMFINDLSWNIKDFFFENGFKSKIFSEIKNVNYEAKNIDNLKKEPTNELYGALGYYTDISLYKDFNENSRHLFKPKLLLKYSPNNMKKEDSGDRLNSLNLFSLNKVSSNENFESGTSATLGFDYEINSNNKKFSFSGGQIINQKENKKMSSESSLDEKLSDFVGTSKFSLGDKFKFDYNFSLDQSYQEINYSDFGSTINFNVASLNFNYLKEQKHYGDNKYFETELNLNRNSNEKISLKGKRNLITNSAEYYDLSYEYFNDCLRAGIVYRREFYNDSEIEPENSLMFKITLIPFGNIGSPTFNQ